MNFKTVNDLNSTIYKNIYKIPKNVDLIVGVPRSGMLVASILSLYLNVPMTDFQSMLDERIYESGRTKIKQDWISDISEAKKILIVEDSSSTGTSLIEVKEKLKSFPYLDKVCILTIFVTDETIKLTDIWFEIVPAPRMFEWNFLHHSRLDKMCFDIDGVLCEDPTPEENDDGEKYVNFIRNAPLRVVPTHKIGYLITSRLEKYRADTEYWLKKNGIQYDELIMMPYETKEERLQRGSHGKFKGENYKHIKQAYVFIESEKKQAEEISRVSGKVVFCIENQKVYTESNLVKNKESIKRTIKKIIPNRIKKGLKKILK